MATAGRIAELLDSLPNAESQTTVLEALQIILTSVHPSVLRDVIPNVSLAQAFDCLNSNDKELITVASDVLTKLLSSVSPTLVIQNFSRELLQCLRHPAIPVKLLALNQLCGVSEDSVESLFGSGEILLTVTDLLGEDDLRVGKQAGLLLANIGQTEQGMSVLYGSEVNQHLQQVMGKNDTVRFRVYELVINISRLSPLGLNKSSEAGYIQQLVNEIHKEDILVQLNSIEMISDLAQVEHGLNFLNQQGIVGKLEDMMSNMDSNPLGSFLLPGLMKFFGGLARYYPKEVCGRFNKFTNTVFESVESQDPSLQAVAIDTVSFIGTTNEGKMALEKLGTHMAGYMKKVGSLIRNSVTETRTKCLQAVSSLIQLKVEDQTAELLSLTENWFSQLFPKPFDVLWNITQQPFTDLRCSTYGIFQSLALQPWGQKLMNEAPGFKEFVTDRSTDHSKEEKEAKFEIVKTLAESPTVIDVFGRPFYVRVMEYYKLGPFFVEAQSEVALEDGGS